MWSMERVYAVADGVRAGEQEEGDLPAQHLVGQVEVVLVAQQDGEDVAGQVVLVDLAGAPAGPEPRGAARPTGVRNSASNSPRAACTSACTSALSRVEWASVAPSMNFIR